MAGLAAIAREAGHKVTGADGPLYPPMSTQLSQLDIDVIEGYEPDQLALDPDVVVVGNVMTRGMPIIETLMDSGRQYTSGPAWLAAHVLANRWVMAVSGTHGKTTTTSLLAWLMDAAGLEPGFLVGGVPANFGVSARLGKAPIFVIEADEYDTAFFDKQAKFLHYGARTLIINNLEFDHADIYDDLADIRWQFHQLLRRTPPSARVIVPAANAAVTELIEMGCWSELETFSSDPDVPARLLARPVRDGLQISVDGEPMGRADWTMTGHHNAENAAAAVLAALHAGASGDGITEALSGFQGVARRQQHLGCPGGVDVYDDFAHHPTAIRRTLEGFRDSDGGRLLVLLEPRSNTMRMGVHQEVLADALSGADQCWVYQRPDLGWDAAGLFAEHDSVVVMDTVDALVAGVTAEARPGDRVVIMSNGGFEGIQQRLQIALQTGSA